MYIPVHNLLVVHDDEDDNKSIESVKKIGHNEAYIIHNKIHKPSRPQQPYRHPQHHIQSTKRSIRKTTKSACSSSTWTQQTFSLSSLSSSSSTHEINTPTSHPPSSPTIPAIRCNQLEPTLCGIYRLTAPHLGPTPTYLFSSSLKDQARFCLNFITFLIKTSLA
jgi:hypothetical protein